jgi:GNAT superfamily N-acetyltransferase
MTTTGAITSIRLASKEDELDAASKLIKDYVGWTTALANVRLTDTRPATDGELRDPVGYYAAPNGRTSLATVDGSAAGFATVSYRDKTPVMTRCYVTGDHRRAGIATGLVEVAVDETRAIGHRRLVTYVPGSARAAATGILANLGFHPAPRFTNTGLVSLDLERKEVI